MIPHRILANSKRLHGRRSSHEFRHRPHGASHFLVVSLFSCLRFRQSCDLWRTHSIRKDVSQFHHLCTLLASIESSFTSTCSLFSAMVFLYVVWANATDMPKGSQELRPQFGERQSIRQRSISPGVQSQKCQAFSDIQEPIEAALAESHEKVAG
jgi:hypothetical protein